jgi:SAM-dependent methyltransferase
MPPSMVDSRAASGFASTVEAYELGRPSYPPEAIALLGTELGLTPASAILDLAAGTGKLTRLLVPLAGRVVAVDPSPTMLAEVRAPVPAPPKRSAWPTGRRRGLRRRGLPLVPHG